MPDILEQELFKKLRDYYQSSKTLPREMVDPGEGLPPVPRPESSGIFKPDPPMAVSPRLAKFGTKLLDKNLNTKNQVSRVVSGPTKGTMDFMKYAGVEPDRFIGTSILGMYGDGNKNKDIALQPGLGTFEDEQVLSHELGHASSHSHFAGDRENQSELEADNIYRDYFKKLLKQLDDDMYLDADKVPRKIKKRKVKK